MGRMSFCMNNDMISNAFNTVLLCKYRSSSPVLPR